MFDFVLNPSQISTPVGRPAQATGAPLTGNPLLSPRRCKGFFKLSPNVALVAPKLTHCNRCISTRHCAMSPPVASLATTRLPDKGDIEATVALLSKHIKDLGFSAFRQKRGPPKRPSHEIDQSVAEKMRLSGRVRIDLRHTLPSRNSLALVLREF